MGFPQIGYQAFKLVAHQRLHELAKSWEERYPGVDIVLIEPEPTDELMFQTSMMNFTSRVEIARHGFESVTKHLAERIRALPGGRRAPRHRHLRQARAQGRRALRRRARGRSAPGARSSRAPPARCCARPARPAEPPGAGHGATALCRSPRAGASVAALLRRRDAHVLRLAERVALGDEHAGLRQSRRQLAAAERRDARPTGSWPGCRRPRSRARAGRRSGAGAPRRSSRTCRASSSEQLRSASSAPACETSETPRSGSSSASSSCEPGPPIA